MALLEITEAGQEGELRWCVSLVADDGVPLFRNTKLLAKGAALSTAKALRHKGSDAPFLESSPAGPDTPAWVPEKTADGWLVRFTLVSETLFDLLLKPEDRTAGLKVVEHALDVVKSNLAKAEIKWNPPEADPAYQEKESDLTPTQGHPGS